MISLLKDLSYSLSGLPSFQSKEANLPNLCCNTANSWRFSMDLDNNSVFSIFWSFEDSDTESSSTGFDTITDK